ncbi:MAG: hypothetical protein M3Q61_03710 [Chloroflexota bacterium]|nr:hypothetical protein [Chloroflexota bacterium]
MSERPRNACSSCEGGGTVVEATECPRYGRTGPHGSCCGDTGIASECETECNRCEGSGLDPECRYCGEPVDDGCIHQRCIDAEDDFVRSREAEQALREIER